MRYWVVALSMIAAVGFASDHGGHPMGATSSHEGTERPTSKATSKLEVSSEFSEIEQPEILNQKLDELLRQASSMGLMPNSSVNVGEGIPSQLPNGHGTSR